MNKKVKLMESNVELMCCACSSIINKGDVCVSEYLPNNSSIIFCEACGKRRHKDLDNKEE